MIAPSWLAPPRFAESSWAQARLSPCLTFSRISSRVKSAIGVAYLLGSCVTRPWSSRGLERHVICRRLRQMGLEPLDTTLKRELLELMDEVDVAHLGEHDV